MRPHNPIHRFLGFVIHGDLGPYTFYTSKDHGLVVYLSAPPKTPPSTQQRQQRNRLRLAATAWATLQPATRAAWNATATRARLRVHGAGLFTWWCLTHDRPKLATIAAQASIPMQALGA
jgi:hypothetical protein